MQSNDPNRSVRQAMRRGFIGRCPRCGRGDLFSGYLTVVPTCAECGEALGRYRAADGPAFFTMTIVGLLLIPILGWSFVILRPDPLTLFLIVTVSIVVLTLVLLRLIKGAFIGSLWANDNVDPGA